MAGSRLPPNNTTPRSIPMQCRATVTDAEISAMYTEYIAPHFPDVSGECLRTATCLYTVTPDAKFIVDKFRDCENIVFASACSGHGFKHSAALGEALALQALGQPSRIDLSGFGLERFAAKRVFSDWNSPRGFLLPLTAL